MDGVIIMNFFICFLLLTSLAFTISTFIIFKKKFDYLFSEYSKVSNIIFEIKEEGKIEAFSPYLAFVIEDTNIYNDSFEKTDSMIQKGEFYTIVYEKEGYAKLLSGQGWVLTSSISQTFNKPSLKIPAKTKSFTNVFNGPGFGYQNIGVIAENQTVEIVDKIGAWNKISFKGKEGFVVKEDLSQ
jgi:hypothetical protein